MNSITSSLKSKLLAFFLLGIGVIAIIILVGFSRAWTSMESFQAVKDVEVATLFQLEAIAEVLVAANAKVKKPAAKSTTKKTGKQ